MSLGKIDGALAPTSTAPANGHAPTDSDDWDLDVTFVEAGDSVDRLIYMTNDGCGSTCQSACATTCP
jgi:FxLD family lantipeptide